MGFCGSDARIYLALLEQHPATGYELARRAGVPRSAIYHALHRLLSDGLIQESDRKPARYRPLPPERLLSRLESDGKRRLEELREAFTSIAQKQQERLTVHLRGYRSMLEEATRLILSCRESLFASLWHREALALAEPLSHVSSSREVVLFSFTELPRSPGRILSYGIDEAELERHWPHKIILVADRTVALLGGAEPTQSNTALFTEEPVLVETAISNLVLDLTLYGQRFHTDVRPLVESLTRYLAPIEELARKAGTLPE
ncbi:MAG: hypothetical protein GYA21_12895 [Myxococcales bacterium]|nr:hypothetical protein [Myxococcales bacterium]